MTRYVRSLWAVTVISLTLCAGAIHAADPPETIALQVSAAPEPRFALQYLFETPHPEQERGNAALLYQTAVAQMMQTYGGDQAVDGDTLYRWYRAPVEDLPLEEVRPALARLESCFRLLAAAVRREQCIWEYPAGKDGFPYVSPLLHEYRMLSRILAIKAKLEIHDGKIAEALGTLRCGIIFGRDVGNGPNLIQHLVGLSMAAATVQQIEGLVQHPQAPNVYWALTALPDPLVNQRHAMQMEAEALSSELPELQTLEDTVLSNEQVIALWERTALWSGYNERHPNRWIEKVADLATVMERYPQAKANLVEAGYPSAKVEVWPALYAVLLDQHHQYRALRDMAFKWTYVPYAQAAEGLKESERAASGIWKYGLGSILINPFMNTLPAIYRMVFLDGRLARDIAMLRCVEAIRMHAAENNGRLPSSLAEITSVPIPLDPLRGEPFEYERTGSKAILTSPAPPDGHVRDGRRYEITLR